jgi:hypothetical protein
MQIFDISLEIYKIFQNLKRSWYFFIIGKMSEKNVDIVALVENNPLVRFSNSDYGSDIISKIREKFTTEEQQMFIVNFYCYLNYNTLRDFVVLLESIWKWLGYTRADNCKAVLVKNFVENVDYKIEELAPEISGASLHGGHNKESIKMTVNCFKMLCLKSKTSKADEIHKYYVNLEEMMNEMVFEQSEKLRNQLMLMDQELVLKNQETEELRNQLTLKDQEIESNITEMEEILITNFSNKKVLYIGSINEQKTIAKAGVSKFLNRRVLKEHKKDFEKFTLEYVIVTDQNYELEDLIKYECKFNPDSVLFGRRISMTYNGKNQTELIQLDSKFTLQDLYEKVLSLKVFADKLEVEKIIQENKKLKSLVYDKDIRLKVLDKEYVQNEEEQKYLVGGTKCNCCAKKKPDEEFSVNPQTNQFFTNCNECRRNSSEKLAIANEKIREQNIKDHEEKTQHLNKIREDLLKVEASFKCAYCKDSKTPDEFGINKRDNKLYKVCIGCRETKLHKTPEKVLEPEPEPETEQRTSELVSEQEQESRSYSECCKCHKEFPTEFNKVVKSNYKTCKDCRKKDKDNDLRNKELLKSDREIKLECTYCHKQFEKELNAKKDGFYKNCKECRDSRKKYDSKKTLEHSEKINANKKEYYQENKEKIRQKQKEYYDENREK